MARRPYWLWISPTLLTASFVWGQSREGSVPRGAFSAQFIGEGGGYQHPTGGAGDYLETGSRQEGEAARPAPAPAPAALPQPRSGGDVAAQPAAEPAPARDEKTSAPPSGRWAERRAPSSASENRAPEKKPQAKDDRERYSLWGNLSKPLALPPAKVGDVGEDEAASAGRDDYESHILGLSPRKDSASTPDRAPASEPDSVPALARRAGDVFVAFDIELKDHPEAYRDAIAGLAASAGFRPDPRFAPRAAGFRGERASVWGWMPVDKVGAAMSVPSVARLQIARPAPGAEDRASGFGDGTRSSVLIGLRLGAPPADPRARAAAARKVSELAADAGFSWTKTIGYQKAPGSGEMVLIVAGSLPVRAMSRVMARADVVKIAPAPPPPPPASAPEPPLPAASTRFFAYVLAHAPFLIVFTIVMAAPGVLRILDVFVPYK